jgi:hypothetical protein
MSLHALDDLDDALDATRAFLWPIDRSRWIKLALVVFFVGGPGANLNGGQLNVPTGDGGGPPPGSLPTPGELQNVLLIVGAVVAVALLIGLVLLLVGSVMEFVLVESLRHEDVQVRQYWGKRWKQGVWLFGFRVVVGLVVLGSAAVLAALFLVPVAVSGGGPSAPSVALGALAALLILPAVIVLALLVSLINGFTTVFIVPVMVLDDCGVVDGWRRLWPTIAANPWQYAAYALLSVVLSVAGGLLVAVVAGVVVLVLLIPFGLLAAVGLAVFSVFAPLGIGVLALVGVLFVLVALAVLALVQVPVVTYLRYYALFVLGDVEETLDLISERRAAVRGDENDTDAGKGAAEVG